MSSPTSLFRRVLVVAEVGRSPTPLRVALREFLPELEGLHVLAVVAARSRHWLLPRPTIPSSWSLAALVQELEPLADEVTSEVSWDFEVDSLPEIAAAKGAECLVLGPNAQELPTSILDLEQLAQSAGLPTVWLAAASVDDPSEGERSAGFAATADLGKTLPPGYQPPPQPPAPAPTADPQAEAERPASGEGLDLSETLPPRYPAPLAEGGGSASGAAASAPAGPEPGPEPGRRFVLPYQGGTHTLAAGALFLRDRARPQDRVYLLCLDGDPPTPEQLVESAELIGLVCPVEALSLARSGLGLELRDQVEQTLSAVDPSLVVHCSEALQTGTRLLGGLLGWTELRGSPYTVVALPPLPQEGRTELDAADLLALEGRGRLVVRQRDLLGGLQPYPDPLTLVAQGRELCRLEGADAGPLEVELGELEVSHLGLAPAGGEDPLAALGERLRLVRLDERPLALLDAAGEPARLAAWAARLEQLGARPLALRLDPERPADELRVALRAAGLELPVLDAGALLDAGFPRDVPRRAFGVRLARTAARLRSRGVEVVAILAHARERHGLVGSRFLALDLEADPAELAALERAPLGDALLERCGAARVEGNRIEVELDNARGRRELFGLIEGARERLHLQVYIVREDEFTAELAQRLVAAAARGVAVRLLVDALYTRHEVFGVRLPLLDRLSAVEGVEVRAFRPLAALPGIDELKQRNHRKLVIADGARVIVTGRNLAEHYYVSFAERQLDPTQSWDRVPWLDAGALCAGPLAGVAERSFLRAWVGAGGEPFAVGQPAPAGESRGRLVLHEGLNDANTLEAYLWLIEGAQRRLTLVNSFPLANELEQAFQAALARGVELRILIGSIRPKFGYPPRPFPDAPAVREVGDQLVRGRVDGLAAAGADVAELGLLDALGWRAEWALLRPQVHAKLLLADGERIGVGSANLDVTGCYWESEVLLLLEDAAAGAALEEQLERLFAQSPRIDPSDPEWQRVAPRRALLSRYWPGLIG